MKDIFEAIRDLIRKISPSQAFLILVLIIVFGGGYFITDRIFDHLERADEFNKLKNYVMELSRDTGFFYKQIGD